jgi:translation initiation factor IF-3
MRDKKKNKINQEITNTTIRLTGSDFIGEIVSLKIALDKSSELGLDLVLINEKEGIGICKIMNYEKFIYEQSKKPKNKGLDIKEIKLGPNTSENDMEYRVKHAIEFLKKGHKVKISLQFRGRQMQHINIGQEQILKMLVSVEDFGIAEAMPKLEGKKMFCMIKPKPSK